MKSFPLFSILLFSGLTIVPDICSAKAVVRIYCDEKDIGTKVFINNQEKGGCDDTLFLSPGRKKLRAVKAVDDEYEQVFEQDLNLFDGAVKRIDISLSDPKLTEVARKARQLKAQQQEEQTAQADLQAAQAGNIKAMKAVAQRFANGKGLQQNSEQAQYWSEMAKFRIEKAKEEGAKEQFRARLKTARSGDVSAMESVARLYETGTGVEKNNYEAQRWRKKVETAKQEKINQKIAQRKREDMERKRIKAAAKRAEIEEELREFTFFPKTAEMTRGHRDPIQSTFNSVFLLPMSLIFDIVSLPTGSTKKHKIKNKLATLPSRWAKPNSMIAKAYQQQKITNL